MTLIIPLFNESDDENELYDIDPDTNFFDLTVSNMKTPNKILSIKEITKKKVCKIISLTLDRLCMQILEVYKRTLQCLKNNSN